MTKELAIGISLSGGGARGIAHVGVLKALEENGISPKLIAGASAGAIVGALYAAGHSPEAIIGFVKESSLLRVIKPGIPSAGLTKFTYLRERLATYISKDDFEALEKKLFVAVTNLNSGELEIKAHGPLFDVVVASSSIPLVFQPVNIAGHQYVDGGLLENMPVEPLVEAADYIIGVNVMPHVLVNNKSVQNIFGIAIRCFELSLLANTKPNVPLCDILIEPNRVRAYHIFQINKYQELYEIGYQAGLEKIREIKNAISEK